MSFSPSKICLRSKRADRTSTPLSIPVPSTSPAGSDKQESKQLSTNSALTSNPNDLLLVSLNLYLFGLTLFTGPFKLFNSKISVLGLKSEFSVDRRRSTSTSLKREQALSSSETGRSVLLRLWFVLIGLELWIKPIGFGRS